jgi:hypothetical protein
MFRRRKRTVGKLVNMYARSDVQYLALKQDFNLDMTVAEALKDKVGRQHPRGFSMDSKSWCAQGGLVYRCRPAIDTLAMIVVRATMPSMQR